MRSEISRSALGSLVSVIIDHRGKTPKKLGGDFVPSGVPVISAKSVKDGRIINENELRYVTPEMYSRWMPIRLQRGDVLLTSEAPLGEVAYLQDESGYCLSQRLFALRADPTKMDGRFLYYALRSAPVQQRLQSRATGTTAQGIRQSELIKVEIPVPPLDEQRTIAAVLGALDDKIELNRRMNATLEAMARALFKSWFVDFDPVRARMEGRTPYGMDAATAALFPAAFTDSPLGPIPAGWHARTLNDIAQIVDCLHSKKPDRQNTGKPLLQLANIRDDGLIDMFDTYRISEADYHLWTSRIESRPGDCVITNVGRVGAAAQIPDGLNAALGRNMTAVRCRPMYPFPTFLIECLLSSAMRDEINHKTDTGTILDALNVKNISKLQLCMPDISLLRQYEHYQRPIRARMEHNLRESATLVAIRDVLLPKLLSGAVRVGDAARVVGVAV